MMYPNALPLDFDVFYVHPEYTAERRRVAIVISDLLFAHEWYREMSYSGKTKVVYGLELGCYKKATNEAMDLFIHIAWDNVRFLSLYRTACYELTSNLNQKNVSCLLSDPNCDYEAIGGMTEYEFNKDENDRISEMLLQKETIKLTQKVSTVYQCPKCKECKVSVRSVQKRSLDENASEEILCLECNHFWINL